MQLHQRVIAVVWLLFAVLVAAASAVDIARLGIEELPRSSSLLGATLVSAAITLACAYLALALWLSFPSARPLGALLSALGAIVACLAVVVGALFAVKLQSLPYALSAVVGGVAAWFFLVTVKVSRRVGAKEGAR